MVMVGVCPERTGAWRGWRDGGPDSHPHFEYARQSVFPNNYYFYIRDPDWGPVIMVGLGGIFVEALDDVRLLPPDLGLKIIAEEIGKLKGARLLCGFRGARARDVAALAHAAARIGALMRAQPEVLEIDINPLLVLG